MFPFNLVSPASGEWPSNYPAAPTLRKDLKMLRDWGILNRRMYRWGYYLGTSSS